MVYTSSSSSSSSGASDSEVSDVDASDEPVVGSIPETIFQSYNTDMPTAIAVA